MCVGSEEWRVQRPRRESEFCARPSRVLEAVAIVLEASALSWSEQVQATFEVGATPWSGQVQACIESTTTPEEAQGKSP